MVSLQEGDKYFFFNDTATTEIYTLSLHDALPISRIMRSASCRFNVANVPNIATVARRSEEHTSELQSRPHLVCRLLLEKKKLNGLETLVIILVVHKYEVLHIARSRFPKEWEDCKQ